jgi:hypothetical protein
MCMARQGVNMAERGLLTDREREIITGEAEVSDSYQYRVASRIRNKIERMEEDASILKEHRTDLLEELQDVVCENN